MPPHKSYRLHETPKLSTLENRSTNNDETRSEKLAGFVDGRNRAVKNMARLGLWTLPEKI